MSGSEHNPDLTEGGRCDVLSARLGKEATAAVEALKKIGADFIVGDNWETRGARMNDLTPQAAVPLDHIHAQIRARDLQSGHSFCKNVHTTIIGVCM